METIHLISRFWIAAFVIAVYSEARATYIAYKLKKVCKIDFGTNLFGSISILSLKSALASVPSQEIRELIEKLIASKRMFYFFLAIAAALFLIPYIFRKLVS